MKVWSNYEIFESKSEILHILEEQHRICDSCAKEVLSECIVDVVPNEGSGYRIRGLLCVPCGRAVTAIDGLGISAEHIAYARKYILREGESSERREFEIKDVEQSRRSMSEGAGMIMREISTEGTSYNGLINIGISMGLSHRDAKAAINDLLSIGAVRRIGSKKFKNYRYIVSK